jgi:5,10-methylene-tetrahydrofolate dehydrogenase/methenyl tetrahydrofolate cyclohydrolase
LGKTGPGPEPELNDSECHGIIVDPALVERIEAMQFCQSVAEKKKVPSDFL